MKKALWLIKHVQSGLQSFMLDISRWTMLHSQVYQLKLIAIKWRHWEQSMLYYMGDSQHNENIQINKVIGENEKCVLLSGLFGQPNTFFRNVIDIWL